MGVIPILIVAKEGVAFCAFFFGFLRRLIEGRVLYSGMIYGLETGDELLLSHFYIMECERTIFEVSFGHLSIDDVVDQRTEGFIGNRLQTPRGCLNRIGHHQDGLFQGTWIRTGISEGLFVDCFIGMTVEILNVEVFRLALTVMGGDETAQYGRQVMLLGHFQAVGHVLNDDLRTAFFG